MSAKKTIPLSALQPNPENPRFIKDSKFRHLVESLRSFPKMLAVRCLVVRRKDMVVIGGNMRLRALKELGYSEIPVEWIKYADEFTDEEIKRFIVQDNLEFGENDWEVLGNLYELEDLETWGMEVPDFSGITAGDGDSGSDSKERNEIIQYNIIFDTRTQYNDFMAIVREMKLECQDPEKTIAALLVEKLKQIPA